LEATQSEVARLSKKKSDSIWTMKKDELIEVARMELGMSLAKAMSETTTVLRERIRANRDLLKDTVDPFDAIPKGLEKMSLAELTTEMNARSLTIAAKMTRPKMIVAIRDDVDARKFINSEADQTIPQTRARSPTRGGQKVDRTLTGTSAEDWTMEGNTELPRKHSLSPRRK